MGLALGGIRHGALEPMLSPVVYRGDGPATFWSYEYLTGHRRYSAGLAVSYARLTSRITTDQAHFQRLFHVMASIGTDWRLEAWEPLGITLFAGGTVDANFSGRLHQYREHTDEFFHEVALPLYVRGAAKWQRGHHRVWLDLGAPVLGLTYRTAYNPRALGVIRLAHAGDLRGSRLVCSWERTMTDRLDWRISYRLTGHRYDRPLTTRTVHHTLHTGIIYHPQGRP